MSQIRFIKSTHSNPMLAFKNNLYYRLRVNIDDTVYVCKACPAQVKVRQLNSDWSVSDSKLGTF